MFASSCKPPYPPATPLSTIPPATAPSAVFRARCHRIAGSGPLLDARGRLREPGYAYRPPFHYNREDIAAPAWRIKDWDYYLVEDDRMAVALTFADLGYVGMVSASVIDFRLRTFKTTSELVAWPLGRMGVPRGSGEGTISWDNARCSVRFTCLEGGVRRLSLHMARFIGARDIEAEFLLDREPRDSLVIATPWAENPRAFYYNRKILGLRARGGVRVGERVYEFGPEALGLLDWGRGVWTYQNTWYWAAAQGYQDGRLVCLNLGYGFGDTSAATENVIFVDGVAHKLGEVDFGIPRRADGSYNYLAPWHLTDDAGRLDLAFSPLVDRTDAVNVASVIKTDQHQVFGLLSGTVVLDDGTALAISGLRASAEHIFNRY